MSVTCTAAAARPTKSSGPEPTGDGWQDCQMLDSVAASPPIIKFIES
jgi:hypothetical protein